MKVNLDQINMLWITHERKTDVATKGRKWPGNKRYPRCVCWFLSTFPGLSRRSSQDSPHNSCTLPPSFCPGHWELQPVILKAEGWISIFHLFTTVPWFRRKLQVLLSRFIASWSSLFVWSSEMSHYTLEMIELLLFLYSFPEAQRLKGSDESQREVPFPRGCFSVPAYILHPFRSLLRLHSLSHSFMITVFFFLLIAFTYSPS